MLLGNEPLPVVQPEDLADGLAGGFSALRRGRVINKHHAEILLLVPAAELVERGAAFAAEGRGDLLLGPQRLAELFRRLFLVVLVNGLQQQRLAVVFRLLRLHAVEVAGLGMHVLRGAFQPVVAPLQGLHAGNLYRPYFRPDILAFKALVRRLRRRGERKDQDQEAEVFHFVVSRT